jgi:hypothetical protein
MIRRLFKFFGKNEIAPYNQYIVNDFIPYENNGGYIRNRTWHWTHSPVINRQEPDSFVRTHVTECFENTTFNEFLRRYDHYEVYIYMITKETENNRIRLLAPSITDSTDVRDMIDFDTDILKIHAILI